jgi:hypothetical protein
VHPIGDKATTFMAAMADGPIRSRRHSQTPVGDVNTYDIEVDHPDHLFVLANGLIVSNSSMKRWLSSARLTVRRNRSLS